jgi:hypothetical protein
LAVLRRGTFLNLRGSVGLEIWAGGSMADGVGLMEVVGWKFQQTVFGGAFDGGRFHFGSVAEGYIQGFTMTLGVGGSKILSRLPRSPYSD